MEMMGRYEEKRLRKFWLSFCRYFLLGLTCIVCASVARAQMPPDSATAAMGPLGVIVTWDACYVFDPSQDQKTTNCYPSFSVYRNPPGFNQSPVKIYPVPWPPTWHEYQWTDTAVKKGQSYTYEVCTGGPANNTKSNCKPTNTVSPPPPPPPPPPQAGVQLTANPTAIQPGYETKLTWTSENATNLILEPGDFTGLPLAGSTSMNPSQTTTYTVYVSGQYGTAKASVTVGVEPPACHTPWSPPQQMYWLPSVSEFFLKWTNPNTPQGQTCPAPSNQVLIYRMGTNGWEQLAALDQTTNNGTLPTRYTDAGPLLPGTQYYYMVCEGGPPQDWGNPNNCSGVGGYTLDTAPVLTATRVNTTTVQLQIAVDMFTVTSFTVRRDGSDDPSRQAVKLGNGLMGCRTVGANGLPVSANWVTVYNWTQVIGVTPNWTWASESAPYLIDIPDDTTTKPGIEYYYQVEVGWFSGEDLDSEVVTVPVSNPYASLSRLGAVSTLQPLKLSGGAPAPSGSRAAAAPMVSPMSRTITPTSASPTMVRPAGSTTAPPPSQSTMLARPAVAPMVSTTSPMATPASAPPMMHPAGPTAGPCPLPSGTAASPTMVPAGPAWRPALQPSTAAKLTIAPMNAPTSRMAPSVRSAAPLPGAANLNAAAKEVQQRPHDAQALYALGKAYCASRLRNTGVSYMYMALLLAERTGNVALSAQIKASLAQEGVSQTAKP